MALSDTAFVALSDAMLHRLESMAEAFDEDGAWDIELSGGVLTIELPNGRQFVINRHAVSKQIWLSSPLSGALHFNYDAEDQAWVLDGGQRLDTLLKAELETLAEEE